MAGHQSQISKEPNRRLPLFPPFRQADLCTRFHRDAGADALPANARSCQQALEPFRAQNILSSAQRRTASLTERAKKHFEYTGTMWHRWSRQVRCIFRNIRLVVCDRLHTDVTVVPYLCNGCFLPRERLCHADGICVALLCHTNYPSSNNWYPCKERNRFPNKKRSLSSQRGFFFISKITNKNFPI